MSSQDVGLEEETGEKIPDHKVASAVYSQIYVCFIMSFLDRNVFTHWYVCICPFFKFRLKETCCYLPSPCLKIISSLGMIGQKRSKQHKKSTKNNIQRYILKLTLLNNAFFLKRSSTIVLHQNSNNTLRTTPSCSCH